MSDDTAVVLGAGIAGLAAAAALSPSCERVVVIERDRLPSRPSPRRGVPQSGQLHNVLSRGLLHLEALFPGFRDEVLAAGGVESTVGSQTHIYDVGRRLPTRDVGLTIVSAWRPTIEFVARGLLAERGNVEVRDGLRANGLVVSDDGTTRGVTFGDGAPLDADLVVDATGVNAVGVRSPRRDVTAERVTFNRWYASTPFSRRRGDGFRMVFPTPPGTRSGLVSPAGSDEWHVSVSGCDHDDAPDGGPEVLAYAATLEDPQIAELLDGCVAVGRTHLFRRPTAVRHRFDLLDDPGDGFVAVGDAAMSLNPLLGLGISSAAWQAAVLGQVAGTRGPLALAAIPRRYVEAAAPITCQAWELSLLTNHPLVEAVGPHTTVGTDRVRAAVGELIWDDVEVQRIDSEMWHLLRPHTDLATPALVDRVLSRLGS